MNIWPCIALTRPSSSALTRSGGVPLEVTKPRTVDWLPASTPISLPVGTLGSTLSRWLAKITSGRMSPDLICDSASA